ADLGTLIAEAYQEGEGDEDRARAYAVLGRPTPSDLQHLPAHSDKVQARFGEEYTAKLQGKCELIHQQFPRMDAEQEGRVGRLRMLFGSWLADAFNTLLAEADGTKGTAEA